MRAMALLFLCANLGIFLAFALRKNAYSPTGVVPVSARTDHVAAFEAEIEKLKSEKEHLAARLQDAQEHLAARLEDSLVDDPRGPWSKVQIWGWVAELAGTHEKRIWGLTDSSGYIPEELLEEDPKLEIELNGFLAFKNYDAWLLENCQSFGGCAHTDVYSPFVVIDGTYVGGYQGFTKAIAENYPDLSDAIGGPIG